MVHGQKAAASSADDVAAKASSANNALKLLDKCFAAGTPILTPNGHVSIESLRPGDLVLARAEYDATAPVVARRVERVFELLGSVMEVHAGGQIIKTTEEHPFYVEGKGWCVAGDLREGDLLVGHNERKTRVERTILTAKQTIVYNLRVATDHTYFVGDAEWGFSLWVHNTYIVTPNTAKGTFEVVDDATKVVYNSYSTLDEANAVAASRNAAIAANAPNSIKGILDALPGKSGKTGPIKTVPDAKALDDLFNSLSNGGKSVSPGSYPGVVKELPDGTIIRMRPGSKSGGATIDITMPDGKIIKVHIQ